MIKQIKQKLNNVWCWIKRKIKKILIALGIISAVLAAGTSLEPPSVPCIDVNGQEICFPYTDDTSNEDLIIYTDKQEYASGDYIYFAVENKNAAQNAIIAGFFQKDNQYISDVRVLIENVPYSVEVPEYATTTYDCSYVSTTTGETITKTCEKQEITGYHTETRYEDRWISQKESKYDEEAIKQFIKENNIPVKDKKGRKAKKKIETYLPEGFTYFRGKINAPLNVKKTEFFLEAIGEGKAYGHLDPWLTGWSYRRKLEIDYDKIDSGLTNFPVMVKLTTSTFDFSKAKDDGTDIRFTDSDGQTLLDFERELHSTSTSLGIYWVEIPSVSSTATTTFYIYYGNSGASDAASSTAPWDSNFKAVYHLDDLTTSTIGDSTVNGNDGTKTAANEPIETDALIGKGQDFDGSNDYINLGSWDFDGSFTWEFWVNSDDYTDNNYHHLLDFKQADPLMIARFCWDFITNLKLSYGIYSGSWYSIDDPSPTTSTWVHFVATYDGSGGIELFKNGASVGTSSGSAISAGSETLYFGVNADGSTGPWDGKVDELRISDNVRSDAWIKATYNSTNDTLLTYGSEESTAARRIMIIE